MCGEATEMIDYLKSETLVPDKVASSVHIGRRVENSSVGQSSDRYWVSCMRQMEEEDIEKEFEEEFDDDDEER